MVLRHGPGCIYPGLNTLVLFLAIVPHGLLADDATMRVRIAWGGAAERIWDGTVSLDQPGTLSQPQPLGIEADEPGSMWLANDALVISQRSARTYDGVDLLVDAPMDAKLLIQLHAADDSRQPPAIEIPLSALVGEFFDRELDKQGNRLLVRRTPGDRLRVNFSHQSLIFSPGETFQFTVEPHLLPVEDATKVRIRVRLISTLGEQELNSQHHDLRAGYPVSIPVEFKLPDVEGVYEVVVTAVHQSVWPQAVRRPLNWKKPIAQRRVQLLVLDARRPASEHDSSEADKVLNRVVEIDPAKERWWERLTKLPKLSHAPRLWKGALGNGNLTVLKHPLGELARLNPNRQSSDVSWEAYWLPIDQPGLPHILEVDYPNDISQTMGISVMEPNAAGSLVPISLDSGVDVPLPPPGDSAPSFGRHRLIFWPRTTTPMVMIANLRDRSPAVYGKIRVLAGWERLPKAAVSHLEQPGRLMAAYLDRPLFPENFSASEQLDTWSGRSLDSWVTFHQGGSRLVEYLQYVGYNALMISVATDGSAIYPSKVLQPTPRYDTGVFFSTAADPVRKDALEMLLRMFDREQMQLIPTIDFSSPLPALESIRRRGVPDSESIEWIGPDGKTWRQTRPTRRALAPYYNVLNPKVQEAMLQVVRELIDNYSHHRSFAAVAIRLSADGYAQLPGPEWGMDDETVARFEQDTGLKIPGVGSNRFASRAAVLTGKYRRRWLQWRAEQLGRFYRRVYAELQKVQPDGRLYLAGAEALAGVDLENLLRPALPRQTTIADALLQIGFDLQHYRNDSGIVLLRPERITPTGRLGDMAMELELGRLADVDQYFRNVSIPGSLFFHRPKEVRIASFDRSSPFRTTYTWLVSQPVPSGDRNRRRFVHSLATLDSQVMVDGGWLLPLGQEQSLRDLTDVYRRLPAVRFHLADDRDMAGTSQPLTFRYGTHQGHTYVYAVNDSPIRCTGEVRVDSPPGCRLEELTGSRPVPPLQRDSAGTYWRIDLQPYDLVAVRLSDPGVTLSSPQVDLPVSVETALKRRIGELGGRTAALRTPAPPILVLENTSFEKQSDDKEKIPGWAATEQLGVTVEVDNSQQRNGSSSARITSTGPVACLVSRSFEPPETGRLAVSVWLRTDNADRQPPLRLAIQGKHHGQWSYYRAAPVGLDVNRQGNVSPLNTQWQRFVFPVGDLPLEGLSLLQVRFDLMGAGEVWIDDVELTDLRFSDNEIKELSKLVTLMHVTLLNGRLGDCLRLLDGYWPRFLEENVPLKPGAMVVGGHTTPLPDGAAPGRKTTKQPSPRTSFMHRIKGIVPQLW